MRFSAFFTSFVAVIGAFAAVGTASAADLSPRVYTKAPAMIDPGYNWTGFYLGANVGGAWSRDAGGPTCLNAAGVAGGVGCQTVPPARINGAGAIGGGQAGYNWQVSPNWVLGLETDIQATSVKGSTLATGPFPVVGGGMGLPTTTFTAGEKLDWLGTFRGRVGTSFGSTLLYATGGLAYGQATLNTNFVQTGLAVFAFPAAATTTRVGWTAGAGLEWGFAPNWSAKVEGLYYDLGNTNVAAGPVPGSGAGAVGFVRGKDFDLQGAVGRVGLNYRFGGPVVARY